jgi:hypothetical protein
MSFNLIGFLASTFVGATMINRVVEGQFITGSDVSILNQMSLLTKVDIGLFNVPAINLTYFEGLFALVRWDYSFFGGMAQLLQFFLYSFTFAVMFIIMLAVLGLLWNAFSRVR